MINRTLTGSYNQTTLVFDAAFDVELWNSYAKNRLILTIRARDIPGFFLLIVTHRVSTDLKFWIAGARKMIQNAHTLIKATADKRGQETSHIMTAVEVVRRHCLKVAGWDRDGLPIHSVCSTHLSTLLDQSRRCLMLSPVAGQCLLLWTRSVDPDRLIKTSRCSYQHIFYCNAQNARTMTSNCDIRSDT